MTDLAFAEFGGFGGFAAWWAAVLPILREAAGWGDAGKRNADGLAEDAGGIAAVFG